MLYSVLVTPAGNLDEALALIDAHKGPPSDFVLAIADSMNDAVGLNMAVLTDRILSRGWMPNGFEQRDGYRVYRYVEMA